MSLVPVNSQVLSALQALILAAATDAGNSVHIGRSDEEPFEESELPAINLLTVDENIDSDTSFGAAVGTPVLRVHAFQIVLQVVTRGGSAAEDNARLISAQCDAAIGADPTLGGICRELLQPTARQWLREDANERRLARENTLYSGSYRTYSTDPYTSV